jgi:alpha-L-rhamnosidase
MIELKSVTIEHHRETLGIGEAAPRISWKFKGDDTNWNQFSYEIEILRPSVDADEPQLFHVESPDSVLVPWPTTPLHSKEKAIIRVRAGGSDLHEDSSDFTPCFTPWSEVVDIEVGLLAREDWTANLIAAPQTRAPNGSLRPTLFRKPFELKDGIRSAR